MTKHPDKKQCNTMFADKSYCMSAFLALRYIEDTTKTFFQNFKRSVYQQADASIKTPVETAQDVDCAISKIISSLCNERLGLFLSGGMDSAILASYLPKGTDAYTFRFMGGKYQPDELDRAKQFAAFYNLHLHYIDINWNVVENSIDAVMQSKGAPVHSIEPQLYYAAQQMKSDGITMAIIGDGSDYVFGGMDGLLAKDWNFDEYIARVTYVDPKDVLNEPTSLRPLFERYRLKNDKIDFLRFYNEVITDESYASYDNAFTAARMPYIDPYERLKLSKPLDLSRIRNGESKYLIRELFKLKYPHLPVPEKLPMPRPVDEYFKNWAGPRRPEFVNGVNYSKYTGNQKWLIWCLERFLNTFEKRGVYS